MTELDILVLGPEIESDPNAVALWEQTGNFIGTALAGMERGRAFSIMLRPTAIRGAPGLRRRECAQGDASDHGHDGVGATAPHIARSSACRVPLQHNAASRRVRTPHIALGPP